MAMSPRLLRPRASGFDPRSIPGLAVWLDASKASSVTLDGNGKVSTWTDSTGNGRNATQTTANNRATYTTAGFGGKNCLTFDGSNASSRMVLGDLSAVFPTYGEIIIAYEAVSDTAYSLYTTKAIQDALLFAGAYFIGTFVATRFSPTPNIANVPSNGSAVVSMRSSGTFVLRLNGVQQFSQAATFEAGTVHTLANRAEGEAGLAFNGKIGEVLLFNADMGAANRAKVEGYLAWKWGTQSQLPYDHPYAKSFHGFGAQTTPTDSDTLTYLAAVKAADGTGVEVSVANAVDDFVKGCKADGIWDAITASCILAGARTLSGALVPLKGAAPTNNNFVSGDYDRETGLVGDESTKYLNTNVLGNSLPTHNAHIAAYVSVKVTGANTFQYRSVMASGTSGIAGRYMMDVRGFDATPTFSIQSTGLGNLASGAGSVVNFIGVRRNTATTFGIRNTGASSTPNGNGQGGVADNILVFAASNAGSPLNHSAHRVAFYSAGEDVDLALLETRVNNLIAAIGAAI